MTDDASLTLGVRTPSFPPSDIRAEMEALYLKELQQAKDDGTPNESIIARMATSIPRDKITAIVDGLS